MSKAFKIILIILVTIPCALLIGICREINGMSWLSFIIMVAWGYAVSAIWKYKSKADGGADGHGFEIDKKVD